MDWQRQGADWPNRAASSFVRRGALLWHVQRMGPGAEACADKPGGALAREPAVVSAGEPSGGSAGALGRLPGADMPVVLLAHGTGSATHSWRGLMPALARDFDVIAVDLPGHGFTGAPPSYRLTLPDMAAALGDLVGALGVTPAMLVGHSAGAAIVARMALDGAPSRAPVVALNGALLPLPGVHGQFFGSMARMVAMMPLVPWFFSWRARDRSAVERVISGTGSSLDAGGIELYARLMRDEGHVGNVLSMMANWELDGLARDLPRLGSRLVLVAAEGDRAVPVRVARKVEALVPGSRVILQRGLGHLSHEEAPEETAALLRGLLRRV